MAEIYPTHALQPHHFLSARRSILEYLNDYNKREISYRELNFENDRYHEIKRAKPMDNRDRHEFAYHVMRFLMMNLLKLVTRSSSAPSDLSQLMTDFFTHFPAGHHDASALLRQLADKKKRIDYDSEVENLDNRLRTFVENFQRQFEEAFIVNATRHVMFRHAATELNRGKVRFVGHTDPNIVREAVDAQAVDHLRACLNQCGPQAFFTSPLVRCKQSLALATSDLHEFKIDNRLIEINYGQCDTLTVAAARERFPKLFEAWKAGEDPRFPGGENSCDVLQRILTFIGNEWALDGRNSATCSHNVVLRELVGHTMRIAPADRYRINIPHLVPIDFVYSQKYGLFIDLHEDSERAIFKNFALPKQQ
jgi:broad specificity phosphatase PhoE